MSDTPLSDEFIDAHYPKSQHQPDECEACHAIYEQAKEANALRADAMRLQLLCDASGQFYENGYEHHMIGRLREYIDSEKAAIDAALKPSPAK